jgi:precorrin-2/cobalt-factor-2 C20-methyltransferase
VSDRSTGHLYGIGVGPGDPELLTIKALRLLKQSHVVAFPAAKKRKSNALTIVEAHLTEAQLRLPMIYPFTIEKPLPDAYETALSDFYDGMAAEIGGHLDAGRDVAVLCEGDPFFFGSFMYLFDRLSPRYPTEVVPGVNSVVACAAVLGAPLVYRYQTLTVLGGVLGEDDLRRRLQAADAAAIMKLGSNFAKVKRVLTELGLADRALYIERATMAEQKILPFAEVDETKVPYFAMVLLPGKKWASG